MSIFSIGHVRSWKYDVRGCGHRMGGHHFMSSFTLSSSHIELLVASPLSLTRAYSLFFHHLIYLLHRVGNPIVLACYDWIRHEFQTWHVYSSLIPHSSLWYFPLGHHFITIFQYHISPLVIFVLCLFFHHCLLEIILVSPWVVVSHTSLHGGLSRSSLIRLMSSGSEILFWEVVLLVRIHVTSVHGESLFIWLCISWEIIHYWLEYAQKIK